MKGADDSKSFLHSRVSVKCDLLLSRFEVGERFDLCREEMRRAVVFQILEVTLRATVCL